LHVKLLTLIKRKDKTMDLLAALFFGMAAGIIIAGLILTWDIKIEGGQGNEF